MNKSDNAAKRLEAAHKAADEARDELVDSFMFLVRQVVDARHTRGQCLPALLETLKADGSFRAELLTYDGACSDWSEASRGLLEAQSEGR